MASDLDVPLVEGGRSPSVNAESVLAHREGSLEDVGLWEAAASASQDVGTSSREAPAPSWQPVYSAEPTTFQKVEELLRQAFRGPRKYLMGIALFGTILLFTAFPVTFCGLYRHSWCLSAGYRWGALFLIVAALSSFWAALQYFGVRLPVSPLVQAYATLDRLLIWAAVGDGLFILFVFLPTYMHALHKGHYRYPLSWSSFFLMPLLHLISSGMLLKRLSQGGAAEEVTIMNGEYEQADGELV